YRVDEDGFRTEMQAQKERARAAVKDDSWTAFGGAFSSLAAAGGTEFVGYTRNESDAVVRGIVVDGAAVDEASDGQSVQVVLDKTPFYGEQGGQVGDTGVLSASSGARVVVSDT